MFKPIIQWTTILSITLFSSASMCSKDDDGPGKDPGFTSLIGKWELLTTASEVTKLNGEELFILEENKKDGNIITWEFFSNGTMKATQNGSTSVNSNWELKVERLAGQNIDKGTLKVTGEMADQVKAALKLDALVYGIETSEEAQTMLLTVDATPGVTGIFSKFIITYTYHKI